MMLSFNVIASAALNVFKHSVAGHSIKPSNLNGVIFYISSAISCILFLRIDWKRFIFEWSRMENKFFNDKYQHSSSTWSLKTRIRVCIVIGFAASLLNQLLYFAAQAQKVLYIASECNWTNHNFLQDFVTEHLDHIFNLLPYHHALGAIAELGNLAATFYWSFSELFVVLVSVAICYRFQQINKRIGFLRGRIVSNERWNEVRLDYVEVCELLKLVDGRLDKIILLAALNNSYLILTQSLNILA